MKNFLIFLLFINAVEPAHYLRRRPRHLDEELECKCVPSDQCADDNLEATGQGLLDIRMGYGECPQYFDVCCENPILEDEQQQEDREEEGDKEYFKGCGFSNPLPMMRITSDSVNSVFGELPWSVLILLREPKSDRNMYLCGGSLIHPQVVLTAAHCVQDVSIEQFTIRVGEWNTKSQAEPLPHQDRKVQEVLIHQHYNSGTLRNDIALLFLNEPLEFAENIGIICLPQKDVKLDQTKCIAGGWGKDAFKKGKHSAILKKVVVPIVTRKKCVTSLRNTRLGSYYNLHKSFICAGGEKNKDTCKGDGGSPLVCPVDGDDKRFLQVGIVSWGIGCGENDTPGVYVNVGIYTEWIDKILETKGFDTSVYKM